MLTKENAKLTEAYLSISKKENSPVSTEITDTTPVSEPAPNVEMGGDVEVVGTDPSLNTTNVIEPEISSSEVSVDHEHEEVQMDIDNLNSIRESIMKVASFCASGGHLEPWQQQKLAIVMDNLASIARSLRSGCHC